MLDLDHTLVNSAKFSEVIEPALAQTLQRRVEEEGAALAAEQRLLFALPQIGMWTKLRPGVREFLSSADEFFELWIHTNGNRCGPSLRPKITKMRRGTPVLGFMTSSSSSGTTPQGSGAPPHRA